ncbi:MAG: sugar phosphate isomerase/epimerase [Spirochaetales bacterium]|nr:sugar phosphate isomerase/epimerase [Spirochaetales bacterium]
MNNKTGLSLVSLRTSAEVLEFSKSWHRKTGVFPSFELSYHMDSQILKDVSFLKGKVLSAHAPCPGGKYLPNFGSRNTEVIQESFDSLKLSADTVVSFEGDILVLHAGYTLDSHVFTTYLKRKKVLEEYEKNNSYLWLKEGSICKPDYVKSDEYNIHTEETIKNLKEAADICKKKGVKLAVENLNPRLTYLFQMPEDFIKLTEEIDNIFICIDIGHLWISSLVHNFDYFKALQLLTSTGRVISAHIHDNRSIGGKNPNYSDDHESIGTGNVPVDKSVSIIVKNSSANLIVEAASDPHKNLEMLNNMVDMHN